MSCDIISIGSSDEDSDEPPAKKSKPGHFAECTLIAYKQTNTVVEVCDSDDDNNDKSTPKIEFCKKKTKEEDIISRETKTNADCISLTDDEDESATEKVNKNVIRSNGTNVAKEELVINSHSDEEGEKKLKEIKKSVKKKESIEQTVNIAERKDLGTEQHETKTLEKSAKKVELVTIDETDDEEDKEESKEKIKEKPANNESLSESIVIDETSSEDEAKNSSVTPKKQTSSPALADKLSPHATLLKNFVRIVEDSVANSKFEEIIPKQFPSIQRYFRGAEASLDKTFDSLMEENTEKAKKSAAQAVIAFNNVKEFIKGKNGNSVIELEEKQVLKVRKLEKTIKLLMKKIKELEEAECNLSDDEDSAYMQQDRYQTRLNKVYQRYCKYLKKSPHSGRLTYDKIGFISSKYNEINLAINKKFRNSRYFPSYYEVEKVVAKTVVDHKLDLSESLMKVESEQCFQKLGEILQKRRKTELYQTHHCFIENTEDPAGSDASLENILKKNDIEGKEKIEKVCQLYASKQELGEDKEDSENSQKSNGSDVEEEENKEPTKDS